MPHSRSDDRPHGLSRRQFLGALSIPLLAAACGRPPYDLAQFPLAAVSPVGLFPAEDYAADFKEIIGRGLVELGVDVRGRRVFLKPNMVEYESNAAINTHPLVVAGAALAFRAAGAADVVVGEGPGHRRDMEYLLTQTGLYDHLRENRIRFIDLNLDDVRHVPLRSRFTGLDTLALPVELLQADFIVSMPKLKTHHLAGMTASMKNFFGAVPGAVYGWPKNILHVKGIENSILDLNATIRPHFAIVGRRDGNGGGRSHHGTAAPGWVDRYGSGSGRDRCDLRSADWPGPAQDAISEGGRAVSRKPRRSTHSASGRAAVEVCGHV